MVLAVFERREDVHWDAVSLFPFIPLIIVKSDADGDSSLALAEMALVPSIYRKYSTRIKPGFEDISPGITSRFEVFGDDALPKTEVSNISVSCIDMLNICRNTLAGSNSYLTTLSECINSAAYMFGQRVLKRNKRKIIDYKIKRKYQCKAGQLLSLKIHDSLPYFH